MTGQWCWIQPARYCESDYDCDCNAPCSSGCGKGIQSQEFVALEAPHDHVTIDEPVTNEAVTCGGRGKNLKVEDGNPHTISVKLHIE